MLYTISKKVLHFLFSCLILFCSFKTGFAQEVLRIDHRYSPSWWQTLICLPKDPVKTLVGKEGQIFGDYGYGGPKDFSFSIQFDSKEPATWKSQDLLSAQVPITNTIKKSDGIQIEEETFLQIPPEKQEGRIVRLDSRVIDSNWSNPSIPCDRAFQSIALGKKAVSGEGVIEFNIKVSAGSFHKLALGFCEGKWGRADQRPMILNVEGAQVREIDPARDFGKNTPGVYLIRAKDLNHDGILRVSLTNAPGAKDRNVFINGIWMFKDAQNPSIKKIILGEENKQCELYAICAEVPMPHRCYHILVTLKNLTQKRRVFYPMIRYTGVEPLKRDNFYMKIGQETYLSSSDSIVSLSSDTVGSSIIGLKQIQLRPLEKRKIDITVDRFSVLKSGTPANVANATEAEKIANAWWQKRGPSFTNISVPDKGVQDILTSCFRNIFQAEDIRLGEPSFNVGPTMYRGLWIADGTFILGTLAMLNHINDVRDCIKYLLSLQLPGGGFNVLGDFHKENGLVIYMLVRHAMLTQDKQWLSTHWGVIEGCIKYINQLHIETLNSPDSVFYGLLPPGTVDGGIQYGDDYSNTEWCLSGMLWAVKAAKWIGKNNEAESWQKEFDSFLNYFMNSAKESLRKDNKGNIYLPVLINNEKNLAPQKGQWAFCQSVYPGGLFDENPELHSIAEGTMKMLQDHREEGLVFNTGWLQNGLWTYFSSFYGHALEWLGEGSELPQLLYDYANHSSPTLVWREEQMPQGKGNEVVGDMPHNWASAEFIRMIINMIELDRGKDLSLFEGLPSQWLSPKDQIMLHDIRTPFGRINLLLNVNSDGDSAKLHLNFLDKGRLPSSIIIHKEAWGLAKTEVIKPAQDINIILPLK